MGYSELAQRALDLIDLGNLDDAFELLQSRENPHTNVIRAQIFHRKGEIDLSIQFSQRVLDAEDAPLKDVLMAYYWIAWGHCNRADYIKAEQHILDGLSLLSDYSYDGLEPEIAYLYNIWGIVLKEMGDIEKGLENTNRGLEIAKKTENNRLITTLTNNLASTFFFKGDYNKALQYFFKCLELSREINKPYLEAVSLGNIGETYLYQGDYDQAKMYLHQSLEANIKLHHKSGIAAARQKLGETCTQQGEFEEARKYLEESIKLYKDVDNTFFLCFSYYYLGKLNLITDQPVEDLILEMQILAKYSNSQILIQLSNLLEALYLKQSNSMLLRGQALTHLEKIVDDKTLFFEITYEAYIHYIELLIQEYIITASEGKLVNIILLVDKIRKQATERNANIKEIESLILRSKLEILSTDVFQSLESLKQAKEIAESNDMIEQTKKIQDEIEARYIEIDRYQEILDQNSSILNKLQYSGILEYLNSLATVYHSSRS